MPRRSLPAIEALTLTVLAAGIVLRWLYLDADPESHIWNGYITDEGRWIAHARALALFGTLEPLDWHLHLYLAPLFQAASYLVFEAFGVSILTSRLLPALAGTALLLMVWRALRDVATVEARLVAVALLALQPDLLMLGRVAVPEVPVMLLHLLAFLVLMTRPLTARRLGLGGLLVLAAAGTKATALPVIGIFAAIALLDPAARRQAAEHRAHLVTAAFVMAAAAVAAVLFAARQPSAGQIDTMETLGEFADVSTLYEVVSFPFRDPFAPTFNHWLLLAWVGAAGWLAARGGARTPAHAWCAASALWAGLFAVMMVVLAYSPARYKVHVLVPLSLNIAAGLTLLQRSAVLHGRLALSRAPGRTDWPVVALLALPSAVVAAPLLAAPAGAFAPGLMSKLAAIAAMLAGLLPVADRIARAWGPAPLVLFPVVAVLLRAALAGLALDLPFWIEPDAPGLVVWWAALLIAAAAVAAALAATISRGAAQPRVFVAAPVLGYLILVLLNRGPGYLDPHFTMREASRHLGEAVAARDGLVATSSAETLFTETTIPYRSITGREWPPFEPDVLVVSYIFDDEGMLARRYRLVQEYGLHVSPEFYETWPANTSQPKREHIQVYRRAAPAGQ